MNLRRENALRNVKLRRCLHENTPSRAWESSTESWWSDDVRDGFAAQSGQGGIFAIAHTPASLNGLNYQ